MLSLSSVWVWFYLFFSTEIDDEDLNEEQGELMRSLPTRGFKGTEVSIAYLFMYAFLR